MEKLTKLKKLNVAIYDFDGTVYNGDSLVDFWIFMVINKPILIQYLPYQVLAFILWRLRVLETGKFKESFLVFLPKKDLQKHVSAFWKRKSLKIFSFIKDEIRRDRNRDYFLLCISASFDFLLEDIVKKTGFDHLISTEVGLNEAKKLKTANCKGVEKLKRLAKWVRNNNLIIDVKKVVSNSMVDMPLFKIAIKKYRVINGELEEFDIKNQEEG